MVAQQGEMIQTVLPDGGIPHHVFDKYLNLMLQSLISDGISFHHLPSQFSSIFVLHFWIIFLGQNI